MLTSNINKLKFVISVIAYTFNLTSASLAINCSEIDVALSIFQTIFKLRWAALAYVLRGIKH